MLSSRCVKIGVVSVQFLFANEFHELIRVDFKASVTWHSQFREFNNPAIELITITSDIGYGSGFSF